jgi:Terminase small subunit
MVKRKKGSTVRYQKHILDVKEAKFVKAKLKGLNNTQAAIEAGYSPANAPNTGSALMHRDVVREALGVSLQQLGINFQAVVKPITEGLVATRTLITGRGKNPTMIEVPDHRIRLAAASLAWKLLQYEADNTTPSSFEPDGEKLLPKISGPAKSEDSEQQDSAIESKPDTELLKRISKMDEVQLAEAVFSRTSDPVIDKIPAAE